MLLICSCTTSTTVDHRSTIAAQLSAQPLIIVAYPTPARLLNWQAFQWSESDPHVVAYNLYYGSIFPHEYDQGIWGITNFDCVVSNMVPGTTYYLAATAVDSNGVESDLSPELVYTMPTTLEMGFAFDSSVGGSVTNVSVQMSTNMMVWQPSIARLGTNGLWRVGADPNVPVGFFRAVGQNF